MKKIFLYVLLWLPANFLFLCYSQPTNNYLDYTIYKTLNTSFALPDEIYLNALVSEYTYLKALFRPPVSMQHMALTNITTSVLSNSNIRLEAMGLPDVSSISPIASRLGVPGEYLMMFFSHVASEDNIFVRLNAVKELEVFMPKVINMSVFFNESYLLDSHDVVTPRFLQEAPVDGKVFDAKIGIRFYLAQ